MILHKALNILPLLLDSHISVHMLNLEIRVLSVLVDLSPERLLEVCHLEGQLVVDSVVDELGQVSLLAV